MSFKYFTVVIKRVWQEEDKEEMKDILEMKRRHDRFVKKKKDQLAGIHVDHTVTVKTNVKPPTIHI